MGLHDPHAFAQGADAVVERRAYPRFTVALHGVCSIAGGDDATCSILDLSLGGAKLSCAVPAEVGASVSMLMPDVGLVAARVARIGEDGIGVAFTGSMAQRRRIQDYLVVVLKMRDDSAAEDRGFDRIVPLRRTVEVRRADARKHMARIKDVSRSGVALTTTVEMIVGDRIIVGSTSAEVVRVFEVGAGARFDTPLPETFDATIAL